MIIKLYYYLRRRCLTAWSTPSRTSSTSSLSTRSSSSSLLSLACSCSKGGSFTAMTPPRSIRRTASESYNGTLLLSVALQCTTTILQCTTTILQCTTTILQHTTTIYYSILLPYILQLATTINTSCHHHNITIGNIVVVFGVG